MDFSVQIVRARRSSSPSSKKRPRSPRRSCSARSPPPQAILAKYTTKGIVPWRTGFLDAELPRRAYDRHASLVPDRELRALCRIRHQAPRDPAERQEGTLLARRGASRRKRQSSRARSQTIHGTNRRRVAARDQRQLRDCAYTRSRQPSPRNNMATSLAKTIKQQILVNLQALVTAGVINSFIALDRSTEPAHDTTPPPAIRLPSSACRASPPTSRIRRPTCAPYRFDILFVLDPENAHRPDTDRGGHHRRSAQPIRYQLHACRDGHCRCPASASRGVPGIHWRQDSALFRCYSRRHRTALSDRHIAMMLWTQPHQNKMMQARPCQEGVSFPGDGVHYADVVVRRDDRGSEATLSQDQATCMQPLLQRPSNPHPHAQRPGGRM